MQHRSMHPNPSARLVTQVVPLCVLAFPGQSREEGCAQDALRDLSSQLRRATRAVGMHATGRVNQVLG